MSRVWNGFFRCLFSGLFCFSLVMLLSFILPIKAFTILFLVLGAWYFGVIGSKLVYTVYDKLGVLKVD